jgi:serine/threonine-protein kinase
MTAEDELAIRAAARIGTVLRGKYHLDRVLGIGGMAVVYAATHRNRKQFAVKVLNKELSFHADTQTRFLREGYVANSVDHPGSVAVLDDDVAEDGAAFLVMELLDGETVEQLWERSRRRVPLDVVLKIGHQLLDVLAAAHSNGIVHRDVKPANVFLTRTGQLKVLDFGIARLRDVAVRHGTNSGILLGTPAFMAPEQALANASEIDARTDVWAVGATMYTLASGRIVHEASNAIQILMKAAQQPARSLGVLLPEAPFKILHVIDRALAFDKSARWPSAAAMRDAIADASEIVSHRTQVSPLHGSFSDATLGVRAGSDPALSPTLASEPDMTRAEEDAAIASTEPAQKSVALPAFEEVATPAPSSSNNLTKFTLVPTLASAADVTRDNEDEAAAASTAPGRNRAAWLAFEFDTDNETAIVGPAPSSDAPTKIQALEFDDAVLPGSDEVLTDVLARQPRPDERTATMTALSRSRALSDTVVTRVRRPTPSARPFLPAHFHEASARFHVIAQATWRAWPTRLALLARKSLSAAHARPKLLQGTVLVLTVLAVSMTFLVIKQYSAHPNPERAPSVSKTTTALEIPAASENARGSAEADAAAASSETADAVAGVDELPSTASTASVPASTTVDPTAPSPTPPPATRSSPLVRRPPKEDPTPVAPSKPALAPASTVRVKPTAPSPPAQSTTPPLAPIPWGPPSKCSPPYDIHSSGKKIWKLECL